MLEHLGRIFMFTSATTNKIFHFIFFSAISIALGAVCEKFGRGLQVHDNADISERIPNGRKGGEGAAPIVHSENEASRTGNLWVISGEEFMQLLMGFGVSEEGCSTFPYPFYPCNTQGHNIEGMGRDYIRERTGMFSRGNDQEKIEDVALYGQLYRQRIAEKSA